MTPRGYYGQPLVEQPRGAAVSLLDLGDCDVPAASRDTGCCDHCVGLQHVYVTDTDVYTLFTGLALPCMCRGTAGPTLAKET